MNTKELKKELHIRTMCLEKELKTLQNTIGFFNTEEYSLYKSSNPLVRSRLIAFESVLNQAKCTMQSAQDECDRSRALL